MDYFVKKTLLILDESGEHSKGAVIRPSLHMKIICLEPLILFKQSGGMIRDVKGAARSDQIETSTDVNGGSRQFHMGTGSNLT